MSGFILGLRDHLTACNPKVVAVGAETADADGVNQQQRSAEAEGEGEPRDASVAPHILPDMSGSFDTQVDTKVAQKRGRRSMTSCAPGTNAVVGSVSKCTQERSCAGPGRPQRRVEENDLNWFNNPCEFGLSPPDKSSSEGRDDASSPSHADRDERDQSTGGAPRSLLEASRKDVGAEIKRSSSRTSRSSHHHRHRRSGVADGSVTSGRSGTLSTATYARDMYSTTSGRTDRESRVKSPSVVTFEASVASSTRKKKRPPKLPRSSRPETRLPTKLHGLVMELSSLPNTTSSRRAAGLWELVSERVRTRPKEATRLDRRQRSPLSLACEFGNDAPIDVVKALVRAHPDAASAPDSKGYYPIHYYVCSDRGGVWNRSADALDAIVDAYPDAALKCNKVGQTPLLVLMQTTPSCLHGVTSKNAGSNKTEYEAFESMLKAMFLANPLAASIPDKTYSFPLHYASKRGPNQAILLDLIKQCPAALAARDNFGATPLLLAAHWNAEMDVFRTLVAACPASASVRDERGETPLTHLWNSLVHAGKSGSRKDRVRTNAARRAINEATSLQSLGEKSPEVRERWRKIELLLRASYQDVAGGDELNRGGGGGDISSPLSESALRWMPIHAACGTAVPPELVRFAMQIFPGDAGLADGRGRLPLHVGAGMTGYIRLPFERKKSRKKKPAEGASANDAAAAKKPARAQSLLGHLLHEHPRGAATLDRAGRLPLHYAARAGRAWLAIPQEGEEGGVEELVAAEPRAVRTRDETNGMYPFMYLAMSNSERGPHRSYKERRARAEQRVRSAQSSTEEINVGSEEWESNLNQMLEREEIHEMDTLYQLIRLAPDIMVRDSLPRQRQHCNRSETRGDSSENDRSIRTDHHSSPFDNPFIPDTPAGKESARVDKYVF